MRSDADLRTAAETMLNNKLHEIQVVDAEGQVVGLLDETDISRFYLKAADAADRPHARNRRPIRSRGERARHYLPAPLSFLARNSAIMTSRACFGTSAYFWNSIVNSPLPWVAERRSVE